MKRSPEKYFAIIALAFTAVVIFALSWLLGTGNWLWIWLTAWSLTTFSFYGFDKRQARRQGWRVPEIVLHGLSLIGGFVGALAGMNYFHHKTRKILFWIVAVGSALLWVAVWWFFLRQ